MTVKETIEQKLASALAPAHLDVENESRMHNVPPGSETHFKVLVVSDAFEGLGLVDRHRRIYAILVDELKRGVHALTIRALTSAEAEKDSSVGFPSPPCLGGSRVG